MGLNKEDIGYLVSMLAEKKDGISVSKTSTGRYSWDIRIYSEDIMDEKTSAEVIAKITRIDQILAEKFPDEERVKLK